MAVSPKVFRVATYNFACLHSTTQSHFWGNIGNCHMGTLNKFAWEHFIILWNDPNVLTETNYFCMKEYRALQIFFNTINYTWSAIAQWQNAGLAIKWARVRIPLCYRFEDWAFSFSPLTPLFTQLYKWVPGYRQWWKCEWFSLGA